MTDGRRPLLSCRFLMLGAVARRMQWAYLRRGLKQQQLYMEQPQKRNSPLRDRTGGGMIIRIRSPWRSLLVPGIWDDWAFWVPLVGVLCFHGLDALPK